MSIKDFTILSKLGQGAYSSVYKVQRHADKTEYALKKVKLSGLSQKQLQNAVNQVRILASIKCANIVSYKQAFLEGKNLCIIMQFADGGDLYQKIVHNKKKKMFFEEFQIWNLLIQVTRGLKKLHDLKIYHRDLKSANIFMSKAGQIKLGDMNVSKIAKNGLLYTQTGTPYYASPEVWKDQPYDFKSDIWSFGCIIYQMTTLQPPFKGQDMQGLFNAVTNGSYSPIPGFYSKQLASIIKLMLQQNPSNRPSTEKLLKSSLLLKKAAQLNLIKNEDNSSQLLETIRIPKKIHYLTDRLPKSNYDSIKSQGGMLHQRLSTQKHQLQKKKQSGTLPRLQNIIRYHEDLIKKKDYHSKIKHRNQSLEVQGISKNYSNEIKVNRIHHHRPNNNLKYYQNRVLPPLRR